ncbi:hypothetical protein SPRG_07020 [Saprolegnia parasitica CBS 223.65]|uniref:RZ-type domain-containing protein n=1 Tax=Saprolegnia parasitica (strain CBS 223.65) TaxID=695850 RepID=A0A067CKW0_SAPPC|nr:hypothetical protein SPRG_07020 [Saprolegnia parasitica CBS 223.65]KDO27432.1 hypothetical protein SPRG_07020 [Saprolegnia parasitica CBS 223.65]|eukprot:XP_012201871.1 hypothetical protein SPRG_07020 [Saprolegnia parasitica CBS 223.65]
MRSLEPPALPRHPKADAQSTMADHVDFHFRLLREDALAQMKVGLQWYLNPATPARERKKPPRHLNLPRLNVAEGVEMHKVRGSQRHGIVFEIRAPQPVANASKAALKAFWAADSRYTVGSLVCIALAVDYNRPPRPRTELDTVADMACDTLIFGTVADRDEADLVSSQETFRIGIKLLNPCEIRLLVHALARGGNHVLLEVRGLFFTSYAPVLQSLQSPEMLSLPAELQACLYGGPAGQRLWSTMPPYLREARSFDLTFLLSPRYRSTIDLRNVRIESRSQLVELLEDHAHALILDASQIVAFSAAMTQQVCLIQGPPGTGKSYVGVRIVEALVRQPHLNMGPILCVCYTNHALDQFLEELVTKKIVNIKDMVRVGGRSKSEVLTPASLYAMRQGTPLSRNEAHRRFAVKDECKRLEVSLDDVLADASDDTFFQWWKYEHEDAYDDICKLTKRPWSDDDDEDGETWDDKPKKKGGDDYKEQNAKKKESKRFKDWERGAPSPDGLHRASLWHWPAPQRRLVLETWKNDYATELSTRNNSVFVQYEDCVAKLKELQTSSDKRLLLKAKIVGMTTTGCAMHQELVRSLAPKVVLIEEAGEVLEAHLLSCLSSATEHVIQIGDHQQLRPLVNEYPLSYQSQRGYDLDISMFERLVETAHGGLVTLHTQRRMAPDICDLIRIPLYPQLEDGPNVSTYPRVLGFRHPLWFFDHAYLEAGNELSHQNPGEADLVVELATHALINGANDVVILTPYLGQLQLLRRRLEAKHLRLALEEKDEEALRELELANGDDAVAINAPLEPASVVVKSLKQCVRLSTVDNFQGNEADFVLVSTVRNNEAGSTGFLKVSNRVNVMLSRAKHGMLLLGSASTLQKCRHARMFHTVLDILEHKQLLGNYVELRCEIHGTVNRITSVQDMQRLSPDGGCTIRCDARLPCGHACAKLCHPDDPAHVTSVCLEACTRAVAACGHLCKQRCHEACRCGETIPIHRLDCGHDVFNVACALVHDPLRTIKCPTQVRVTMPVCKHEVVVSCAIAEALAKATRDKDAKALAKIAKGCSAPCGGMRDCDHACTQRCATCIVVEKPMHAGSCEYPCDRGLVCGHACKAFCHAADACPPCELPCTAMCEHSKCPLPCKAPCTSCSEPCMWSCQHTLASCPLPCGSPCLRLPCDERCTKDLSCGHQCPGLCGEACPTPKSCRHCAPPNDRLEVVDLIMQTTLEEHDPDESPLVTWPCGHSFTTESMDGYLDLGSVFALDAASGKYTSIKPLTLQAMTSQRKSCPLCRQPLRGVHRYARVLNFQSLYEAEIKYLNEAIADVAASTAKRAASQTLLDATAAMGWFQSLVTRCGRLAPSHKMAIKELHFLQRNDTPDLNMHRYRNTMQSKALTLLQLEALQVALVVLHGLPNAEGKAKDKTNKMKHLINTALKLEAKATALCVAVESIRSLVDCRLVGLKLRLVAMQSGLEPYASKDRESLLREMRVSVDEIAASAMASPAQKAEAEQWYSRASGMGALTQAEKKEIFQVFARDPNGYNSGFGGHWYSCPNGHPYVITECGGAMEVATCPECKAPIGGNNHSLLGTNQAATAFFQSG